LAAFSLYTYVHRPMIQSFLISLAAASERRTMSMAALEKAGLGGVVIDAVDGRDLPPAAPAGFGRTICGAEQGCLNSHHVALRRFLDGSAPLGLIAEDDIAFVDGAALVELADWLAPRTSWDVVHLSAAGFGFASPWGTAGGVDVFRAHLFPMTSPALLWSRPGAEAFLKRGETWPMDHALRRFTLARRSGLALGRPLVGLGAATSLMVGRNALVTQAYRAVRKKRRRQDRARAAWNRLRWQMTGR